MFEFRVQTANKRFTIPIRVWVCPSLSLALKVLFSIRSRTFTFALRGRNWVFGRAFSRQSLNVLGGYRTVSFGNLCSKYFHCIFCSLLLIFMSSLWYGAFPSQKLIILFYSLFAVLNLLRLYNKHFNFTSFELLTSHFRYYSIFQRILPQSHLT